MPSLAVLAQPLLMLFPHGGQHHARRNAYRAVAVGAANRADREAANAALTIVASPEAVTVGR